MSLWEGFFLGLVQGLTEFLPISSSGHLALAEAALGVKTPGLVVEIALHVATLLAVFIAFRARLVELARGAIRRDPGAWQYIALLVVGTIPAAIVGVLFEDFFKQAFGSLTEVGIEFILTGIILWSTRWIGAPNPGDRLTAPNATLIGVAQAAAILPAISRSGTTVAAGMWLGIDPVRAGEFSFLLSIPAIGGAALLELPKLASATTQVGVAPLALGFVVSLVTGVLSIRWLVTLLRRRAFHWFAPYCWVLGVLTIGWAVLGR